MHTRVHIRVCIGSGVYAGACTRIKFACEANAGTEFVPKACPRAKGHDCPLLFAHCCYRYGGCWWMKTRKQWRSTFWSVRSPDGAPAACIWFGPCAMKCVRVRACAVDDFVMKDVMRIGQLCVRVRDSLPLSRCLRTCPKECLCEFGCMIVFAGCVNAAASAMHIHVNSHPHSGKVGTQSKGILFPDL